MLFPRAHMREVVKQLALSVILSVSLVENFEISTLNLLD